MKYLLKLCIKEWKLLMRSKLTIAMILLIHGFLLYSLVDYTSINDAAFYDLKRTSLTLLLNSANHGGIIGAMIFGILSIFLLDKDQRKNTEAFIASSTNFFSIIYARVGALMMVGVITIGTAFGTAYGIHVLYYKIPFDFAAYIWVYGFIIFGAILLSIFIGCGFYLIIGRLDMSMLSFGIFFFIGLSSPSYLLAWIKPQNSLFSDFAGIEPIMRLIVYNRFFSILVALGIFLGGLLVQRYWLYERLHTSFCILVMIFLSISVGIWYYQPYVNEEDSILARNYQGIEGIEMTDAVVDIDFFPEQKSLKGTVYYEFQQKEPASYIDFMLNSGLKIDRVLLNGVESTVLQLKASDQIRIPVHQLIPFSLEIKYHGKIKYPIPTSLPGYLSDQSIYLQEGAHWVPTPLVNQHEKIHIQSRLTAPSNMTMVSVGKLENVIQQGNRKTWEYFYDCNEFDVGAFAAMYNQERFQVGETQVEFYYSPKHEEYVQNLHFEERIKDIVSYYQRVIGPYPFSEVPLQIAETSIYKTGGHSTSNVVTVGEEGFNRRSQVPEYNYYFDIQVLAHEIAHQWWGTGVKAEESSYWSEEGLANYYSYKYMEKAYGESLVKSLFISPWKAAVKKNQRDFYTRNPEFLNKRNEKLKRQLRAQVEKVDLYYHMPLVLIQLERERGEEAFLNNMSELYHQHLFGTLTYQGFLTKMDLGEEEWKIE